jgi:hypothetical protein
MECSEEAENVQERGKLTQPAMQFRECFVLDEQ